MLKRIVSFLMVCVLCFSCAVSLAEEAPADAPAEKAADFQLAGFEDVELRLWDDNAFFKYMEEATGVVFGLKQYNKMAEWKNVKASYTAGQEDMPDVLFKAALTDSECMSMLEKGVLVDLKPYLEKNCPNLWAKLQENPEYMDAVTLPGGEIVALPYINQTPKQNCMWINKDFLKVAKKKVPTTKEELEDVLNAFKMYDVNQNGNPGDEVPMGFLGAFDLKFLAHAYGLYCNDYNVFVKDGEVRFMPLEENFRPFIEWCHDLFSRGLLDPEGFSTADTIRHQTKEDADPVYGMVITTMVSNIMPPSWEEKYELVMPLFYEGKQLYRDFSGKVTKGTFAVTSHCKDVEKVLQWVDYLYSPEGAILAFVGKENVDYLVDGDHTWRLTPQASSDKYHTVNALLNSATAIPGISAEEFQKKFTDTSLEKLVEQVQAFTNLCSRPFPYYSLTQEQIDFILPIQNQIGYYVDLQIGRWVIGEEEISDETFFAFEKTLNEMGLKDFMNFWQDIYNTQNK